MRCIPLLTLLSLSLVASAAAPAAPDAAPKAAAQTLDDLEAVLVTGERPGPALWKVTRKGKDNVLWILPAFEPLPTGLILRSAQLERVIGESQEVHFFRSITPPAYLENDERANKAQRNDSGRTLQDVVSPELYAQFRDLADRYASGSMMIDNFRPLVAAEWLKQMAMNRLQLTNVNTRNSVIALSVKHGVQSFGVKMTRDKVWDDMYERLDKIPRESDAACARARLDHLEKDLQDSVVRANAWAKGDIATLRADVELGETQKEPKACADYLEDINVGVIQQSALRRYGYAESRKYLKKNRSTLVVVPIADLFEKDGLIRRLKRAGYRVEEPPSLPDPASEE